MAIPAGLGTQLGISTESTYGTYVAPTQFHRYTSESLRLTNEYVRTAGLGGQGLLQPESLHTKTTRQAGGDITFDVVDKGLGRWLNLLHGNTVTPAAMTGGLWRQLHNIGTTAPTGKSATIQIGRPDVTGTSQPFSYLGCKVVNAVFTLAVNGVVSVTFTIDGQDETTSQTLATETLPAGAKAFSFQSASVEFDDVVLTDCVSAATVTIPLALKTDRMCLGNNGLKKEPIPNALMAPTIALTLEFTSLTQHTAFKNATRRKVELNCTGSTSSGTYSSALNFVANSTVATGQGPVVDGPDVLTQDITLEVLNNGTATPLVVEYIAQDSAI